MMMKLLMRWTSRPDANSPISSPLSAKFAPKMMRLGLQPTEAWYTVYGQGPQISTGGVANESAMETIVESGPVATCCASNCSTMSPTTAKGCPGQRELPDLAPCAAPASERPGGCSGFPSAHKSLTVVVRLSFCSHFCPVRSKGSALCGFGRGCRLAGLGVALAIAFALAFALALALTLGRRHGGRLAAIVSHVEARPFEDTPDGLNYPMDRFSAAGAIAHGIIAETLRLLETQAATIAFVLVDGTGSDLPKRGRWQTEMELYSRQGI